MAYECGQQGGDRSWTAVPAGIRNSGNAARGPWGTIADAKPGEVRVLATAAIRIPLDAVRAEASKAIGHPLVIEYGSARGNLKEAVMAGTGFEVAMLLPDVDEQLLKSEILPNKNLSNTGPVIPELQVPVVVTATISANTPNAAAAKALVQFLQGPAIEPALKGNGFSR